MIFPPLATQSGDLDAPIKAVDESVTRVPDIIQSETKAKSPVRVDREQHQQQVTGPPSPEFNLLNFPILCFVPTKNGFGVLQRGLRCQVLSLPKLGGPSNTIQ